MNIQFFFLIVYIVLDIPNVKPEFAMPCAISLHATDITTNHLRASSELPKNVP